MEAVRINKFPEKPLISSPIVRGFFNAYVTSDVKEQLWQIYRHAVLGGLSENGKPLSAEEVATLFDQLIALTGAVEALQQSGSGASLCKVEGGEHHV